jgi:hypothetical protein
MRRRYDSLENGSLTLNGYEVFAEYTRQISSVGCSCTPNDVCSPCYGARREDPALRDRQDLAALQAAMEVVERRWIEADGVKALRDLIERLET